MIAYASTEQGEQLLRSHSCRPNVFHVTLCPTIRNSFSERKMQIMRRLCETYDPTAEDLSSAPWSFASPSLGYGSTGALIVFAHGAPNNVPLMFHKASRRTNSSWTPLFPSRVSAGIDSRSFGVSLTSKKIKQRLEKIGQRGLAKSVTVLNYDIPTGKVILILAALSSPPRLNDSVLARRTGLPTYKVARLCQLMTDYGWIDSRRRLTDGGHGQLRHARKKSVEKKSGYSQQLGTCGQIPYYPKVLRHPI
ncbi:hypothetical protein OURE66S_02626 [Oligella ureolytica]